MTSLWRRAVYWFLMPRAIWRAARMSHKWAKQACRQAGRYRFDDQRLTHLASGEPVMVELHPSYAWTCEVCSEENYTRPIIRSATPEECAAAGRVQGVIGEYQGFGDLPDEYRKGTVTMLPVCVRCEKCAAAFMVEDISAYGEPIN
jgi:hypothetical protein